MTIHAEPGDNRLDPSLSAIMSERRQLINLGYRLLGSLADAEDVVQETYARWYAMSREQQEAIESPGAWLMKVASRICLDLLSSARARRESYVGEWIPEPLPDRTEWINGRSGGATNDPADRVTLDESINMAFLVLGAERFGFRGNGRSARQQVCATGSRYSALFSGSSPTFSPPQQHSRAPCLDLASRVFIRFSAKSNNDLSCAQFVPPQNRGHSPELESGAGVRAVGHLGNVGRWRSRAAV